MLADPEGAEGYVGAGVGVPPVGLPGVVGVPVPFGPPRVAVGLID